ncbi:Uncharacterised protein [Escherichia coli]|uniref:Uncharacterized protein n=1 Tax=Escherichia coli TaxID=562 RepID=A0A377F563_ECOLX|nr:Uncharacterised protein [Escherichia coli]
MAALRGPIRGLWLLRLLGSTQVPITAAGRSWLKLKSDQYPHQWRRRSLHAFGPGLHSTANPSAMRVCPRPPVDQQVNKAAVVLVGLAGIDNLDALSVGNQFAEACGCLAALRQLGVAPGLVGFRGVNRQQAQALTVVS